MGSLLSAIKKWMVIQQVNNLVKKRMVILGLYGYLFFVLKKQLINKKNDYFVLMII